MKKKKIISILGLCLIISAHAAINKFLFGNEQNPIVISSPLWVFIYFIYIKLMVEKYLKL